MCKFAAMFAVLVAVLVAVSPAISANDSALTYGGTIAMLKGHPTVRMESELIKLRVSEDKVTADCTFVFKNDGPQCQVRMGFPDEGYDGGPTQDGGWFQTFKSTVDGKPVKTYVVEDKNRGEDEDMRYWHVKDVTFPAQGTSVVHDFYTVPIGGAICAQGMIYTAAYTVSTGASWKGNIGRTEIVVTFDRSRPAVPLRTVKASQDTIRTDEFWHRQTAGTVCYRGIAPTSIQGKTIHFVRMNWRPTKWDDLTLYFAFKGLGAPQPTLNIPYLDVYPFNRALTDADLKDLSGRDLQLMRNAVYARHGRPFKDPGLRAVFTGKSWYKPDPNWQESRANQILSPLERANLKKIASFEKR